MSKVCRWQELEGDQAVVNEVWKGGCRLRTRKMDRGFRHPAPTAFPLHLDTTI